MTLILLTAIAFLLIGYAITDRIWPRSDAEPPGPLEQATYAALIAISIWLGTTWLLALTSSLTPLTLGLRGLAITLVAVPIAVKKIRSRRLGFSRPRPLVLLAFVLLALTIGFALFRGAVLPPVSHDALAYHLPKAVLFARAEGFRYLIELDPRQRNIPANYEMLLAEIVILDGRDDWTEAPSTAFYTLFVIACGALAERWWRNRNATLAVVLAAAGSPVALLHSAAHKNDLMTAFFIVAAMVAAGRWIARREPVALLLMIAAIGAGVGTKPQVAMIALALAPVVGLTTIRSLRPRALAAIVVFGIAAFLLLGGTTYLTNLAVERGVVGKVDGGSVIRYGAWRNLWQAPYVLIAAPFAPDPSSLFVPWEKAPWYWRRYELYFSHLGIPFAVCAALLPLALLLVRELRRNREALLVSAAALAAFVIMLPVVFRPHGMFAISLPRYALFIVPIVLCWTLAPLLARYRRWSAATIGVLAVALVAYAIDTARNDAFAPLEFVRRAARDRSTREVPFDNGRAATVVDRLASRDDVIAVDSGYASWIHPLFGRDLSRPVYFIPPGDGPPRIPAEVDWIVIDRSWGIAWEKPGFDDLSEAEAALRRGKPKPEELRVRRALAGDPRFTQEYVRVGWNQVVYRRVEPPVQ